MCLLEPPVALLTWNDAQPMKLPFASTTATGMSRPDRYVSTSPYSAVWLPLLCWPMYSP